MLSNVGTSGVIDRVNWDPTSLAAFFAQYDVLFYTHSHLMSSLSDRFSDSDIASARWMQQHSGVFEGFYLQSTTAGIRIMQGFDSRSVPCTSIGHCGP